MKSVGGFHEIHCGFHVKSAGFYKNLENELLRDHQVYVFRKRKTNKWSIAVFNVQFQNLKSITVNPCRRGIKTLKVTYPFRVIKLHTLLAWCIIGI